MTWSSRSKEQWVNRNRVSDKEFIVKRIMLQKRKKYTDKQSQQQQSTSLDEPLQPSTLLCVTIKSTNRRFSKMSSLVTEKKELHNT